MKTALKAEFRKILTTRSTYLLLAIALALSCFISFWVFGYKDVEHASLNSGALLNNLFTIVSVSSLFLSFLAVLLVGHEYRYNLIMYTLTSAKSRRTVFLAKLIAVSVVALFSAAVIIALGYGLFYFGHALNHIDTVNQYIPVIDFIWRAFASILGSVILAFVITMLIRSLIAAVTIILVMPTTVEPLLGLLLKDNTKYLPYTSLGNITNVNGPVSYLFSIKVVALYALVLGIVAIVLFRRRDAN